MNRKKIVFGIDLGTTNSALAACIGERPEIVHVAGQRTVPSCIAYLKDGTKIVGSEAYAIRDQSNIIYSSKRFMGSSHKFKLTLEDDSKIEVTPVEAATEVLKYIKDNVDANYGKVEDVVITVPAYFNSAQRQDTLKAAKEAGINCLKIINEPTAASLVYGSEHKDSSDINQYIVIDIGGGTTDITVINMCYVKEVHKLLEGIIEPGYNFDIVSTGGNNCLGGDDYDAYIFEHIKKEIMAKCPNVTEKIIEKEKQSIIFSLEKFKKHVFDENTILGLKIDHGDENETEVYVKYEDYVKGFQPFWEDILKCVYECVGSNPLPKHCILVGGSTKNPLITEYLEKLYKSRYGSTIDLIIPDNSFADESVALGAAIYAASITGNRNDIRVKEVNPLPIGIECAEKIGNDIEYGIFQPIISKDTALPVSRVANFITASDNQTKAIIKVYQGTSHYTKLNQFIGELVIDDIKPAPAGEETYSLNINISFDGLVSVKAYYNDKVYETTLKNILGETKTLSAMEKMMLKTVTRGIPYYESVGDVEKCEILDSWQVGNELPEFLAKDAGLINEYYINKSTNRAADLTHKFNEEFKAEDEENEED